MNSNIEESVVDVLIVGAGPAGLMLANWMSRLGIKTRIVDKRGTKIFNGQADGMQSRTLEIFDSFGFAHRAWIESNHMLEMCLWNPDPDGTLRRTERVIDTIQGLSRFQQAVLHQGRIERFLLDSIKEHSGIRVERLVLPEALAYDESKIGSANEYPITVTLRHLPKDPASVVDGIENGLFRSNMTADDTEDLLAEAKREQVTNGTEVVKARYLVGCDGAHSWVRKQLGPDFELVGDSTEYVWGVIDVIPITDFPDIRTRCAIHSADSGSMMIIPRENKLTRLYIQLTTTSKTSGGGKLDRSAVTPDTIMAAARNIIAPYQLSYKHCDWWTAYQIGQRVGKNFSRHERVFLAGDAVHTHSPKAGQGMNVSMQDTYNLGWKLAHVVKGIANPIILKTYQAERRRVAQDLIDFDHRFSRLFSGRPAKDITDEEGINMEEFRKAFVKGNLFTSGIGVRYGESIIVAKDEGTREQNGEHSIVQDPSTVSSTSGLAKKIDIGMRMPSFKVLNQSDARPWHLQELLKSDGRWRLLVFAGTIKDPAQYARVSRLADVLASPKSFLHRFCHAETHPGSSIEVLTIHSSPRAECTIFDLPEVFRPFSEEYGWDYWKIYVDDQSYHEGHGQAYENYGIDPIKGCAVIVRPDQHVSWIGDLEDFEQMDSFFSAFMEVAPAKESSHT